MKEIKLRDWPLLTLPFGVATPGGILRDFTLNPMDGDIRQQVLQDFGKRSNSELLNLATQSILKSLGPVGTPPKLLVQQLLPFDRTYILLASKYQYWPKHLVKVVCSGCKKKVERNMDLGEVNIRIPEESDFIVDPTPHGSGVTGWSFLASKPLYNITEARMRMPTCGDDEDAYKEGRAQIAFGVAYYLIGVSLLSLNSAAPPPLSAVKKLPGEVLEGINKIFEDRAVYGPDLDVDILCDNDNCAAVTRTELPIIDHFLGSGDRRE